MLLRYEVQGCPGGDEGFLRDALFELGEQAAEGLATFDEYAADIDKIYIEGKFEQLLSTIDLAKKHGGWDGEVVDGDTNFVPLVVMPDTGVPTGIITNFDIIERGRKMFEHLQPHVYPAGLITVSDVQLLEGMADSPKSYRRGLSMIGT
jgi:hypothetical protein